MKRCGRTRLRFNVGMGNVHNIKKSSGAVVAADTQSSSAALDAAFITQARLCATVVEAAAESKLPAAATQKLLDSITAGMRGLVASREEFVTAVHEINAIQARSNLREVGFGCPSGLAPKGSHFGTIRSDLDAHQRA